MHYFECIREKEDKSMYHIYQERHGTSGENTVDGKKINYCSTSHYISLLEFSIYSSKLKLPNFLTLYV